MIGSKHASALTQEIKKNIHYLVFYMNKIEMKIKKDNLHKYNIKAVPI